MSNFQLALQCQHEIDANPKNVEYGPDQTKVGSTAHVQSIFINKCHVVFVSSRKIVNKDNKVSFCVKISTTTMSNINTAMSLHILSCWHYLTLWSRGIRQCRTLAFFIPNSQAILLVTYFVLC